MEDGIIATHYRIDAAQSALTLQGGLTAYPVIDRRDPSAPLIAIETRPDLPARPRITLARNGPPVPYAVLPVDYGSGRTIAGCPGWFVIGQAPPGTPIGLQHQAPPLGIPPPGAPAAAPFPAAPASAVQPWRETDLIALILIPAAAALAGLQARGLTHRAINPDNLYHASPRDHATLGPFWAAPPACHQPPVFEPPYMALCLPSARGDGAIADDIYALGVTLLSLAIGRIPLAALEPAAIQRRKLELGSFEALTADASLPPLISDLLRGMLAEDPDHRPSPALLTRPEQARARRVAARPPRRAQLPLDVGSLKAWSARELAHAIGAQPERGHILLKSGDVERWLRRTLGDPQIGMRVEEVLRRADPGAMDDGRQQALTVMRCVAAIDPLAPLVWRGIAFQPDGIGPAIAGAPVGLLAAIQEIVATEAVQEYCVSSAGRHTRAGLKEDQRDWRIWLLARGPAGGVNRLAYGMNPMLACASPLLAGHSVVRVADLLPALDAAAAAADRTRPPMDSHIAGFIAARAESAISGDLATLTSFASQEDRLAVLRLFGRLQTRLNPDPLPNLAAWLVSGGLASVQDWASHHTRIRLENDLKRAVAEGRIADIATLLDDVPSRRADRLGAAQAVSRVEQLEDALAAITRDATRRADAARHLSYELVTGAGLLASLGAVLALAMH